MSRPSLTAFARDEGTRLLQVLGLGGIVFAQPVLDVFGDAPDTFLSLGVTRREIVAFALAWALAPAGAIWVAGALTGLAGSTVRRIVHVVTLAVLAGVFVVQVVEHSTSWARAVALGLGVAGAALAGALVARVAAARTFSTALAISPLLVVMLFLVGSPVGDLVLASGDADTVEGITAQAPVVLVVLDELPTASLLDASGRIDAGLFPNLASLAGDATWYRNHTSVATFTQAAVPAIFTGRLPGDVDAVPIVDEYPENLFTLLGGRYTVNAFEPVTTLCPADVCTRRVAGGGFRALLRRSRDVWFDRFDGTDEPLSNPFDIGSTTLDAQRDEESRAWAATVAASPGARLDAAHVLLPHQLWYVLPSFHTYETTEPLDGLIFTVWATDDAARVARQRHLLQAQAADHIVGEVLARLREQGTYDDALVVVTADHGVAFREGAPIRALTERTATDVAWTPLLVKRPGQTDARVDDRNALTIDILPTIADVLGVELPWEVDGVSLLGAPRDSDDKPMRPHPIDELQPAEGEHLVTLDGGAGFRALLDREPAVPARGELRVYREGRYGDLVGRRVDDLDTGAPVAVDATLRRPVVEYDPAARVAPVYVEADVRDDGHVLALAVNGRVAGWAATHEGFEQPGAWFLVPEELYAPGRNELTLYVVDGLPTAPVLHPLE